MKDKIKKEFIEHRRWFDVQWPILERKYSWFKIFTYIFPLQVKYLHTCPCCGYPTLESRNWYQICPICWWEDDGQDDADADETKDDGIKDSLSQARENFCKHTISFNPSDERFEKIGNKNIDYRKQMISSFEAIKHSWNKKETKETKRLFEKIKKLLNDAIKTI